MSYENRIWNLPVKYWIANNDLHRAFYEWDSDTWESPRDWEPMARIVNATDYNIAGREDTITNDIEQWLLYETGINEEWYENHRNSYGIEGLVKKFKKQCAVFYFVDVKDYNGFYRVRATDEVTGAFIYIPKTERNYQILKTIYKEKAVENAKHNLFCELDLIQDWLNGKIYCLVQETYNREAGEWEVTDRLSNTYLLNDEEAEDEIENNFGEFKELEEDLVLRRINDNSLDVLFGQGLLDIA
jgi:hypothetical protein